MGNDEGREWEKVGHRAAIRGGVEESAQDEPHGSVCRGVDRAERESAVANGQAPWPKPRVGDDDLDFPRRAHVRPRGEELAHRASGAGFGVHNAGRIRQSRHDGASGERLPRRHC